MTTAPSWYSIRNNSDGPAEVFIYDRIGGGFFEDGVEAKTFTADLNKITASEITMRINSPGGSVFEGQAIASAVSRHPAKVTAHVDGLAASIATIVALAADEVVMNDNALWMIHDPRVMADGTADELRSVVDLLDRITDTLVATYAAKTGIGDDDIRAAMKAETWYSAAEAHAAGFADRLEHVGKVAASFDLAALGYRNAPTIPAPTPVDAANPEGDTVDQSTPVAEATAPQDEFAKASDLEALQRQVAAAAYAGPKTETHPLAAFKSLGEYAVAVFKGDTPSNVIADQITTDNPGVLPPAWINDVKGIVNLGRPAVSALGVQSAGNSGMSVDWPYFDGDINALVGAQATEKTDVTSVKVSLKKGAANLATYAGGSDISYQLIMRSSPSYIDAYLRIMAAAYAAVTDNAFVDALVAGGTASAVDYDLAADTDGTKFRSAIFVASTEVESATGSPATAVLVASDVWAKIGGWSSFVPGVYGTFNVGGTAQASTLAVNVSGIPVIHDRNLAAGSIIVSNGAAASFLEDGPRVAQAETPTKLGRDVAIWGLGATALFVPKGVVKVTNLP